MILIYLRSSLLDNYKDRSPGLHMWTLLRLGSTSHSYSSPKHSEIFNFQLMMLCLVSSLAFQITFGAEPLASISRPFHIWLPFHNTTTQITLRTQVQVWLTILLFYNKNIMNGYNNMMGAWMGISAILLFEWQPCWSVLPPAV